ncbi:rapamycin-insensitive companion of mTOR isoform X2 [Planococcus citri]|uniref:rapamycin-insensitive companion of mTOR isoform X2 n=1 Tax=Planococcus citri TaxID=170843 RepID=UPI0031F9CF2D
MAVASWMLRSRTLRAAKALRGRTENKDEAVKLDFTLDPKCLMREILSNVCQKYGVSSVKKLNYLNSFVHLLSKNSKWKSPDTFGFSTDEILCCLRIALIQDSVQVRAAGLRALRYVIRTEEDVLSLNRLQFPYLISRSLDLLLKTDNERVLMSERIQSLKMMRHILFLAPQHFNATLVRPLVSVALRPIEETDRLLKACLAVLCEICVLNSSVFIECDGVRALLRNANTIPSSHMTEAICGALLFLLNKPSTREPAKIELRYLISGYTNSFVTDKNSFREEERRLMWTNFVLLTLLRSSSGLFQLCNDSDNVGGLKSIVKILYLNQHNIRKAVIELLFELMNIPQPEWTDDEVIALDSVEHSRAQESFRLSEGYLVDEGRSILPSLSKNRVNLVEVHTSLILLCLMESDLPDALVEVIISSDSFLSLQASILLGEFLHLSRKILPSECFLVPPSMPNLISYATRGCPLHPPCKSISNENSESSISHEQYSSSYSHCSKDFHYNYDSNGKLRFTEEYPKVLDVRLPPNLNVPDNITTKSSPNETVVTKDRCRSSAEVCNQDIQASYATQTSNSKNLRGKPKSLSCNEEYFENLKSDNESILNINRTDFPPCKHKQQMALSAMCILTNLRKQLEKPRQPVSLLLNHVVQYGEKSSNVQPSETSESVTAKSKLRKISPKVFDELIKETGVLVVPEPSRWKWESVRILLKLGLNNSKKLNDTNFKTLIKKLVYFYKPSSKKFSHMPMKLDSSTANIYTIVACDLIDILMDTRNNDGTKLLNELLEDIDTQLKQIIEAKSVHDCLFSPQRLTNSLSQDYFLLLGRLSNCEAGLLILKKLNILQSLHHIAININMDCYVKLIVSSLSYVTSEDTKKLFSSVLSCNFVSSRMYGTKYLHVLLRTSASKHESFRNWAIEMLANQLHDDNNAISSIALNALNEAADNKDYLEALISLRPSLLHLGDKGLLLLIRFLSTEKGFSYLQAANFVAPQLQRWATSFNAKYTQIVEGELHDAMSQYQRGDDGRYRQRITDSKAVLKDVFVPPHLYGQLVQHSQGFNLLIKQEIIPKMIQVILMCDCDTDEAILELKSALWAIGHFSTSSFGAKYLSDRGIIKVIVGIAEKCAVYSVKVTAFYILSLIASTKEGVAAISKTTWRCLKRTRHEVCVSNEVPFSFTSFEKFSDDDDSETISSPVDFESPLNDLKTFLDQDEDGSTFKIPNKFSFEKKSATLPQRGGFSGQIQHNRSYSESKADASDEWSSSGSPPSNLNKSNVDHIAYRSDSCGTDSSTSGISSCDSVYGKPSNYNERISTLSPIPSTSSLTTVLTNNNPKESRTFLSTKRHSSISFGCRLSAQSALGYKTLRMLQNRHHLGTSSSFSATATMEYLSAHDRRQMSPLVRPKFPRYIHEPLTHEFEVKSAPFHIDENENANVSSVAESSQFSHSTEIDEEKSEPSGPCYQGICLPIKTSYLLPCASKNSVSTKKSSQVLLKSSDEIDVSAESDSEMVKNEEINRTLTTLQRKRRHERSACLLCSSKSDAAVDGRTTARSRKTSTSSLHRIRTETESSYGGGVGPETESPILLTWQQKPVGIVDNTPGGASSSTLDTSESQANSLLTNNENSLKSRSILRKEVLKLIEQLGNPILHKTCKQCLLHLKQICGDLFQDICLFSDVCSLLGSINYRIHARQLIQDLFLEAPFFELYEEPLNVLNRPTSSPESTDPKTMSADPTSNECSSQVDSKSIITQNLNPKEMNSTENSSDERKTTTNHNLEVIVETDALSEATKSERGSMRDGSEVDDTEGKLCDYKTIDRIPKLDDGPKSHHDCRRAYSYPATSYIVTGFGSAFPNLCSNESVGVPTTRSRSFSTNCSYISEISLKPCVTANKNETLKTPFDTSSMKGRPQWC